MRPRNRIPRGSRGEGSGLATPRTDHARAGALGALLAAALVGACDAPNTEVVLDNEYLPATTYVVYRAFWQAISFETPVPPGFSSDPQTTIAASANVAYVLLAPGWDPTSATAPSTFVVLQSRGGFGVSLNQTLHIPVDDARFAGNCAAGSHLSQAQADFLTQIVFASEFLALSYDAASCTTTPKPDAGAP